MEYGHCRDRPKFDLGDILTWAVDVFFCVKLDLKNVE